MEIIQKNKLVIFGAGKIGRSFRFDTRNSTEKLGMVSVIIDAKKPLIVRHKLL